MILLALFALPLCWYGALIAVRVELFLRSSPLAVRGMLKKLEEKSGVRGLRVRKADLGMHGRFKVLGMATWSPFGPVVYIDRGFLQRADIEQLAQVFAHELGHIALGHSRARFMALWTGTWVLWWVFSAASKLDAAEEEDDADDYAEDLTGFRSIVLDRGMLYGYYRGVGDVPR